MAKLSFLVLAFVLSVCFQHILSIEVWMSSGDSIKRLNREPDIAGQPGGVGGFTIDVNRNEVHQFIKGFGGALTNSAAYLIYNSFEREQVLQALFSVNNGIGLSYVRLVMGGSDFNAVNPYTYDDAAYEDFNLAEFNIAKDQAFVLPVLKDILRINPEVKIMASPWSAPAWMKASGTLYGGQLKPGAAYLSSLADFFVKFIQAYQAEGITIDTLTLQNEPEHETAAYPTMRMSWDVQRDLIRDHLGPKFAAAGITTGILIWDHNWEQTWYPMNILNDAGAKQYIAGTAWHCYEGNRYDPVIVMNTHPDKDMYFSECTGGAWDEHFGSTIGWQTQNLFIGQTRIGSRTVLLWNLALDENSGPIVGANGCTNCRGVVTVYGGTKPHDKNIEYYSLGHFTKFVRAGARRIGSPTFEDAELETVAFQNPDGSVAVIVVNTGWDAKTQTFQVFLDGEYFYYQNLPSRSVLTFYKP